jgi:hypothetical protein
MRIESFRGFAGQTGGRCHFIRLVFFGNEGIAGEAYVRGARAVSIGGTFTGGAEGCHIGGE